MQTLINHYRSGEAAFLCFRARVQRMMIQVIGLVLLVGTVRSQEVPWTGIEFSGQQYSLFTVGPNDYGSKPLYPPQVSQIGAIIARDGSGAAVSDGELVRLLAARANQKELYDEIGATGSLIDAADKTHLSGFVVPSGTIGAPSPGFLNFIQSRAIDGFSTEGLSDYDRRVQRYEEVIYATIMPESGPLEVYERYGEAIERSLDVITFFGSIAQIGEDYHSILLNELKVPTGIPQFDHDPALKNMIQSTESLKKIFGAVEVSFDVGQVSISAIRNMLRTVTNLSFANANARTRLDAWQRFVDSRAPGSIDQALIDALAAATAEFERYAFAGTEPGEIMQLFVEDIMADPEFWLNVADLFRVKELCKHAVVKAAGVFSAKFAAVLSSGLFVAAAVIEAYLFVDGTLDDQAAQLQLMVSAATLDELLATASRGASPDVDDIAYHSTLDGIRSGLASLFYVYWTQVLDNGLTQWTNWFNSDFSAYVTLMHQRLDLVGSIFSTYGVDTFPVDADTWSLVYNLGEGSSDPPPPVSGAWIASLVAAPDPVERGRELSLIAQNVVNPVGDVIQTVFFYRDANGNGTLETTQDQVLGQGVKTGSTWIWTGPAWFPEGSNHFMAQAVVSYTNKSAVAHATGTVIPRPEIPGSELTVLEVRWSDQGGDDDGVVEGRETIGLDVRIRNAGSGVISGTEASLSSTDPTVVITDSLMTYNTLDPGEEEWGRGDFELVYNAYEGNSIPFTVRLSYTRDGQPYYQTVSLLGTFNGEGKFFASFSIVDYSVDDSPALRAGNNGNGIFESGEKVAIRPRLRNIGNTDATDVGMRLDWTGAGVLPFSDIESYPDIPASAIHAPVSGADYSMRAERTFSGSVFADVSVEWDENPAGQSAPGGLEITVEPVAWVHAEWTEGIANLGFGVAPPGPPLTRTISIENYGSGDLMVSSFVFSHPDLSAPGQSFPFTVPAGGSHEVQVSFDTTGLNETVLRTITIHHDGRQSDPLATAGESVVILSGSVTTVGVTDWTETFSIPDSGLIAAHLADLDNDGKEELVTFHDDIPGTTVTTPQLRVLSRTSNDQFSEVWNSGNLFAGFNARFDSYPLAVGDLNGDGFSEIVVAVYSTTTGGGYGTNGKLYIFSRTGVNTWGVSYSGYTAQGVLLDAIIADWDADGQKEVILTVQYGSNNTSSPLYPLRGRLYVLENRGGNSYTQIYSISDLSDGKGGYIRGFSGLTVADSDLDGNPELIFAAGHPETNSVSASDGDQLYIYERTGNNAFTKRYSGLSANGPNFSDFWNFAAIAVGDPDGDGKNELMLSDEGSRTLWIWEISGNNTWATDISESHFEFLGTELLQEAFSVTTGDLDGDGVGEVAVGTDNVTGGSNAFIFEAFAEDSYALEWSGELAPDNVMAFDWGMTNDSSESTTMISIASEGVFFFRQGAVPEIDLVALGLATGEVTEGFPTSITANIQNQGNGAVGPVTVRFFEGDPAVPGSQIGADVVIPTIDPYQVIPVGTGWTPAIEGSSQIVVVVDPDDAIVEMDETNNSASLEIVVEDSDTSPPVVMVDVEESGGDGDGQIGSDEEFRIMVSADDPSGIASLDVRLAGFPLVLDGSGAAVGGPLAPGKYPLVVTATDGDAPSPEATIVSVEVTVVPAETLAVLFASEEVANGSHVPGGTASSGGVPPVFGFRIFNGGSQSLAISSLTVSPGFSVSNLGGAKVGAEGELPFIVSPDSSAAGNYSAAIALVTSAGTFSTTLDFTLAEDADLDGIADEWEEGFFGSTFLHGSDSITDGDGIPLVFQYQWGLDPTLVDAALGAPSHQIQEIGGDDYFVFEFNRRIGGTVSDIVEVSTDGQRWDSSEADIIAVGSPVPNPDSVTERWTVRYRFSTGEDPGPVLFRMRALSP